MVQASRRELHLAARQRGNERRARREALADAERERQKALRSRYSVATAKRESSPRATGRETVLGPDGSIVAVDVVGFSLRKAEDHQRHAAERIAQDHELATSGLRSNGFEYQSRGTRTDMSHFAPRGGGRTIARRAGLYRRRQDAGTALRDRRHEPGRSRRANCRQRTGRPLAPDRRAESSGNFL